MDPGRLTELLTSGGLALPEASDLAITGDDPVLATPLSAGGAAATALGLVGTSAARLHELRTGVRQAVRVDVQAAAASLLGFLFQQLDTDLHLARYQNPVTALFPTRDGRVIHLHGGFPHLERGLLDLLDCAPETVAQAVSARDGQELEDAVAQRGLCAALVRSADEWLTHPQGQALAALPVVTIERIGDAPPELASPGERPLSGVRVLDLTRVLAGPTCARTLAEHGAQVLRVGSPNLPSIEPFVVDTGRGKRNAALDLDRPEQADLLRSLVRQADVFSQGYRPGSLARRGFGPEEVAAMRPGVIYVSIDCYGQAGPWAGRPGWEQLAQSATGMAEAHGGHESPALVPAAATDYTTGYLAACGVMNALAKRAQTGGSWHVRASLCQTGMWILRAGSRHDPQAASGLGDLAARQQSRDTAWGRLTHLAPALEMTRTPPRFELPPSPLGSHPASFDA